MRRGVYVHTTLLNSRQRPQGMFSTYTTHRDDEGEVDANGEVRHGEHVEGRQLEILQGLDEAYQVAPGPATSHHQTFHQAAKPRHHPAFCSSSRTPAQHAAGFHRRYGRHT